MQTGNYPDRRLANGGRRGPLAIALESQVLNHKSLVGFRAVLSATFSHQCAGPFGILHKQGARAHRHVKEFCQSKKSKKHNYYLCIVGGNLHDSFLVCMFSNEACA